LPPRVRRDERVSGFPSGGPLALLVVAVRLHVIGYRPVLVTRDRHDRSRAARYANGAPAAGMSPARPRGEAVV
jgi:hypothetical protein